MDRGGVYRRPVAGLVSQLEEGKTMNKRLNMAIDFADDAADATSIIDSPGYDLRQTAIMLGTVATAEAAERQASALERIANSLEGPMESVGTIQSLWRIAEALERIIGLIESKP